MEKKMIRPRKELDLDSLIDGFTIPEVIEELEKLRVEFGDNAKFELYVGDEYADLTIIGEQRPETDEEYAKRIKDTRFYLERDIEYAKTHISNYTKRLEEYTARLEEMKKNE